MTNDELDQAFQDAINSDWHTEITDVVGVLASQVSIWRGQANYWCAAAAERAETIETLKEQIKWLNVQVQRLS